MQAFADFSVKQLILKHLCVEWKPHSVMRRGLKVEPESFGPLLKLQKLFVEAGPLGGPRGAMMGEN